MVLVIGGTDKKERSSDGLPLTDAGGDLQVGIGLPTFEFPAVALTPFVGMIFATVGSATVVAVAPAALIAAASDALPTTAPGPLVCGVVDSDEDAALAQSRDLSKEEPDCGGLARVLDRLGMFVLETAVGPEKSGSNTFLTILSDELETTDCQEFVSDVAEEVVG